MRHNLDSIEEFSVEKKRRAKSSAKLNELSGQESTIACMNKIIKTLREYNSCKDVMDRLEKETAYIGKKLSISPIQSILLAVIAEEAGPSGGSADSDDITRFMGITNLELMNFTRDIEEMSSMHIVRIVRNSRRRGDCYMIYDDAMEAIRNDREYSAPSLEGLTADEVFSQLRILFSEFFDDALTTKRLTEEMTDIIEKNQYEFSGGQIENITRNSMINYVIEGEKPTMEDLVKYCDEECFAKSRRQKTIGFE